MKYPLLILTFSVLPFLQLSAQSFITAGANYSVLSYEPGFSFFGKQKLENFKLTPSIGYGYNININDKWAFKPAIMFGDLGDINDSQRPRTLQAVYAISLNHSVHYKPLPWLSLGLSPTVNYILYAGITGKVTIITNQGTSISDEKLINWKNASASSRLNRLVFSLIPSVTFHLNKRWSIDWFYRNDLTPVGYPARFLNYTQRGYGTGINLRYQLEHKKKSGSPIK